MPQTAATLLQLEDPNIFSAQVDDVGEGRHRAVIRTGENLTAYTDFFTRNDTKIKEKALNMLPRLMNPEL